MLGLLAILLALLLAAPAAAQTEAQEDAPPPESTPPAGVQGADTPVRGALYETGADGKYLVGGTWLFRQDPADQGLKAGFARASQTAGWQPVTVPHVWNARDVSDESMLGSIGWYRKDFRVPKDPKALKWNFRFESANYRLTAWLNGKLIGRHEGVFLPFEIPAKALVSGVNRLVLRIDSRTGQFDLPPGGPDETGRPDGGWWNYGGLPREVYMRRIEALDIEDAWVHSELPCRTCAATVFAETKVRNTTTLSRPARRRPTAPACGSPSPRCGHPATPASTACASPRRTAGAPRRPGSCATASARCAWSREAASCSTAGPSRCAAPRCTRTTWRSATR